VQRSLQRLSNPAAGSSNAAPLLGVYDSDRPQLRVDAEGRVVSVGERELASALRSLADSWRKGSAHVGVEQPLHRRLNLQVAALGADDELASGMPTRALNKP
jgi:hypothetical protein